MVIPGHNLGNSQVSVNRTIGPILVSFFDENFVSKQNSTRWDAAFCGVPSGAILFAYIKRTPCLYGLRKHDIARVVFVYTVSVLPVICSIVKRDDRKFH